MNDSAQPSAKPTLEVVENNPAPQLKVVFSKSHEDQVLIDSICKQKKIVIPTNWGMKTGTANWNVKSKAHTLLKRLDKAKTLSEKIHAIEQYKDSFESFLEGKVGQQEDVTNQVQKQLGAFLTEVSVKFGITKGTLNNLMDHFKKSNQNKKLVETKKAP